MEATKTGCGTCSKGKPVGTGGVSPYTTSPPDDDPTDPDLRKRAIAGRITMNHLQKRGASSRVTSLSNCRLQTPRASPLFFPAYPAPTAEMLDKELNPAAKGPIPASLSTISRYDRATSTGGCVFTTTRLDAKDFSAAPAWSNYEGKAYSNNNDASLDHACK
jgi:hypothetical protein